MKKNTMMRIASVLLIAVLMTTCVISGTFAKYTSTFTSAESSASVAKWAFTLGKENPTTPLAENFSFALFDTITDTVNGAEDADVLAGKIAPGTKGSFTITLNNISEVNATYTISLNEVENTNNIPIKYSLTGAADSYTLTAAQVTKTADIAMTNGTADITVYWMWAFEAVTPNTDANDTALGTAGTAEVVVDATITVTQKD